MDGIDHLKFGALYFFSYYLYSLLLFICKLKDSIDFIVKFESKLLGRMYALKQDNGVEYFGRDDVKSVRPARKKTAVVKIGGIQYISFSLIILILLVDSL